MFNNSSPYTLMTEVVGGITRYYVSFLDGEQICRETEVSRPVYLEFLRFVKIERNLRRWDERHIEQSELTDETLYSKTLNHQKSVEDTAFDSLHNEKLRLAIQDLPETQRRRLCCTMSSGFPANKLLKWKVVKSSRSMSRFYALRKK